jgi:alpha-mannosidase
MKRCVRGAICLAAVLLAIAGRAAEPRLTVVNVSSHCDWCWGHTRAWHEERYAETIRQVLLLMREHPHYRWLLENENEQLRPFLAKAAREWPGLVDEFWRRVREGRIEVIVAISNPRLTEVYPETLVRNLVLGHEYFARHVPGYEQRVYNAVDLMCGPSQMPQILAQAGFRYFMFSRPMGQQVVFWRRGLDGTRMLTAREFYGYNASGKPGVSVLSLPAVPVWRHAIGGDDVLPDPKVAVEAKSWNPQQKILGTAARYFEEVEKHAGQIKELSGPLDSLECYVEAGLHGQHSLYLHNNQDEDLLLALETAQVMAGPRAAFSAAKNDALWHDLLACTGHAIQWAWASDYDERMQFGAARRERIRSALDAARAAVASQIRFRRELGTPVVVFNPHGWPVSGPVRFARDEFPLTMQVRDGDGRDLPVQNAGRDASSGLWNYLFAAQDVPGCGYKTYYLTTVRGRHTVPQPPLVRPTQTVENEFYRASQSPDGRLEIVDKATGRVLGDPTQGSLGEVVFYDAPPPKGWMMNGPLGPRHMWQVGPHDTSGIAGPTHSLLSATGRIGPHTLVRELRLDAGCRRLDFHVSIDAAEGNGAFVARFPLGIAGHVTAGIPFGAEPRDALAQEPFRGEFFVKGYPDGFAATRWTDVSTDRAGYSFVCPWGAHSGYAWHAAEKALEFTLLRLRPLPTGEWGKMSPSLTGTGHHEFDYALLPHAGIWREAATPRAAMEFHMPLTAVVVDQKQNASQASLADRTSWAEVTPPGVMLSSLRPLAGTGRPVELRLYESQGRPTDAVVRLGQPLHKVTETDLLGRPTHTLEPLELRAGAIHLRLKPWRIVTLRVE